MKYLLPIILLLSSLLISCTSNTCGSLGDSYMPGEEDKIECCEGLKLRTVEEAYDDFCRPAPGFEKQCTACGDKTCDPFYEDYCNCPEDCQ